MAKSCRLDLGRLDGSHDRLFEQQIGGAHRKDDRAENRRDLKKSLGQGTKKSAVAIRIIRPSAIT